MADLITGPWSQEEEEEDFLRGAYRIQTNQFIANFLDRSRNSVGAKAARMGLTNDGADKLRAGRA